ncbi:MAG: right-handed parallel beta-helix repeat-containing protein, partial [Ilumatobacteraceae bacterium]
SLGAERVSISRCQVSGRGSEDGIRVEGGSGHVIASCETDGHRHAVHLVDNTEAVVRGNNLSAQQSGVWLERTEGAHVHANFVGHTTRGIDIDGGSNALVHGNAICDGDSGAIVRWGATGCSVTGNTWERCRIGVLVWEAPDAAVYGNEAIDLHEPDAAFTAGP